MFNLYFGNLISIITTVLVLGMLSFIIVTVRKNGGIDKWGRRILVVVLVGTAISALSATRDAFMMADALFTFASVQALVCFAAGGLIFLTGIVSIFVRNQKFKRAGFMMIAGFFVVQVLSVEVTRIALL